MNSSPARDTRQCCARCRSQKRECDKALPKFSVIHEFQGSAYKENRPVLGFEQPKPDYGKPNASMDNFNLFHDGNLRCPKCIGLVQRLAEVRDNYLDDDIEDLPGHMDRKKVSKFPKRKRKYEPDSLCTTCKSQITCGQYHKLSDHLLETHEAFGKEDKMPSEGCCYFCLLLLQFKCKYGCLYSATTLSAEKDQPPLSLGLSWFWNLQIFSNTIDEPLRIDRYLPQGLQLKETDSIRIVPWKKIHWPMVKSWLRTCEDDHAECNQEPLLPSSIMIARGRIFIDVHHKNLVTRRYNSRYVTLSYVWGGVPQLLLKKSNAEALFQDGSLKELGKEIPQVIRDAMQVVNSIGEELLWVDSLCIVQDDESVKDQLISEMASIYSGALVTLVAASGENANSGLSGVRDNSRMSQDLVEVLGTGLAFTYWIPFDHAINHSIYSTRGWTFQERLLSRRCLYFTETQIFFECQKYLGSEDRTGKQEGPYPNGTRTPKSGNLIIRMLLETETENSRNKDEIQTLRYSKLVEEYYQRKFTFTNDIINAFAGIESAMENICKWTMIYGLPKEVLDSAIIWEPGRPRNARETTNPSRLLYAKVGGVPSTKTNPIQARSSQFPSWSWAAWMGDICYNEWSATDLRVLHSPFELGMPRQLYHTRDPFNTSLTQTALVHPSDCYSVSKAPLNEQPKPSVLRFSAECLPGSVFLLRNTIFREKHTCLIFNRQENRVGTIPGVEDTFVEHYESTSVDMILLSASKLSVHRFQSLEDMGYPSIFDLQYPRDEWSIFTIMLAKWDKGYAKRLALGYIHRDAWKEADPKVKDILLA
ncbi:HET-domain-containing protein [Stipitochalara longipes BDJ]|nr:HET-domain-containing protein [Stipitochalara longipes BDJ]